MPDAMFVVRYSQNGPYLTIKFESGTKADYEKLRDYILKTLKEYPKAEMEPGSRK